MSEARYKMTLLRAGRLLLDAGGMFGVIPRVVWSRNVETDDKNRVVLSHNCLLLERIDPKPDDPKLVLIEAGTGDKLDDKMRSIFGLEDRTVETAVIETGHDPREVEAVVVSHLHFDHAGGLTRRARGSETPDWTASDGESSGDAKQVCLTFPRAEVITQAREWRDALDNTSVMTKTYYRDHLLPLEKPLEDGRARVRTIQSPPPYPLGITPMRGEHPLGHVEQRMTEVLPGVHVLRVPGHTWGQQAVLFTDEQDRKVCFSADLIPTAWHAGQAYSLAYDVEPYTSMVTKSWFLEEAERLGWILVLDHEPGEPLRRVVKNSRGWFDLPVAE